MKRFSIPLLGISLLVSAAGCCCGWPGHGYNSYYGNGACQGGACGPVSPQTFPPQGVPQGVYYNGQTSIQPTGMQSYASGPFTAAPVYHQTAMGPLESLPTY